jgi:hypothetical protein
MGRAPAAFARTRTPEAEAADLRRYYVAPSRIAACAVRMILTGATGALRSIAVVETKYVGP